MKALQLRLVSRKKVNANNIGVVAYDPGTFVGLPPGLEPKFAMPNDVSGNYMEWMKHNLRKVAKGVGITKVAKISENPYGY